MVDFISKAVETINTQAEGVTHQSPSNSQRESQASGTMLSVEEDEIDIQIDYGGYSRSQNQELEEDNFPDLQQRGASRESEDDADDNTVDDEELARSKKRPRDEGEVDQPQRLRVGAGKHSSSSQSLDQLDSVEEKILQVSKDPSCKDLIAQVWSDLLERDTDMSRLTVIQGRFSHGDIEMTAATIATVRQLYDDNPPAILHQCITERCQWLRIQLEKQSIHHQAKRQKRD
jgi:hypothetical protein